MAANGEVCTYRIDCYDTVTDVGGNWVAFARANGWDGSCSPQAVVGQPVGHFFQGLETRELYEKLFAVVRAGKDVGPIPFRCDSPGERRFIELYLAHQPAGAIQCSCTVIRTEPREPMPLLDPTVPRSDDLLTVCSMCKKVAISAGWYDMEEALVELRLFEADRMPGLTHAICPGCFRDYLDDREGKGPDA